MLKFVIIKIMELKKYLKTTDRIVGVLEEGWIKSVRDFFYNFPKSYEDRSTIKNIDELTEWEKHTIRVKPVKKNIFATRTWKKIIEFKVEDEKWNVAYLNFINMLYMLKNIKMDEYLLASGKPKYSFGKRVIRCPALSKWDGSNEEDEIEKTETATKTSDSEDIFAGKIVPIYAEIMWIKSKWFAKKIYERLWDIKTMFGEFLPSDIINKYKLQDIHTSMMHMHFPENMGQLLQAKGRFYFEKLFVWQLISNYWRKLDTITEKDDNTKPDRWLIKEFLTKLPFELTGAQKRVLKTVIDDFHGLSSMLRLLQWDVWSWKTVVVLAAAWYMVKHFNKQVAFMAPTEVLANQHYMSIAKLFLPMWLRIALLTWPVKLAEKKKIKEELKSGKINIIVWTHALIQDDVDFAKLWFGIIDEQHKFGVNQRSKLNSFGDPHVLQMTATPIPRSLALSYFWEFECSIIDEMPPWRKDIYTKVTSEDQFYKLKQWVLPRIDQWQQIYIVCPLIQESEKLEDIKSAFEEFEIITSLFKELKKTEIWLMHGKLKSVEKEKVMKRFKDWKTKILVSTTVIEVWVDVPQATVMVIKNAERFWLAQLHQLRWRVWRSDLKSYCFLVSKVKSWDTYRRLKAMEKYNDWFKLAELDLQMRWAWEMLGTRQSWQMDIPDEALKDIKLLENTRHEARELLKQDPELKNYPVLRQEIERCKFLV